MQAHSRPVTGPVAILRAALSNFLSHDPFQAAAALSYYSLSSLAPLVIVIAAIGGLFFSDVEIQAALTTRIRDIFNEDAAAANGAHHFARRSVADRVANQVTDSDRNDRLRRNHVDLVFSNYF